MLSKFHKMLKGAAFLSVALTTQFSAQAQQTLKMGTGGASTTATGPVYTNAVTMQDNGTATYTPTITATYTLNNQQFPAGTVEGLPSYNGFVMGVNSPSPQNNTSPELTPTYTTMDFAGSTLDNMFTACPTCGSGTGVSVASNYATEMMLLSDALTDANSVNKVPVNSKVYYANLTITFNRPVSNPVIHIAGMGGQKISFSSNNRTYGLGFSAEFELISTQYTMTRLSGTTSFTVSGVNITNSATYFGASSQGVNTEGVTRTGASGSIVINGTNITSVTFKVYLRGDGGRISNTSTGATASAESPSWYPAWAFGPTNPLGNAGTVTGDVFTVGLSLLKPVTISGTIFHDKDGGNVNNSTGSANNIATGIYANLIDDGGKVVASVAVPATGVYSFPGTGAGTYTVQISTNQGVQGANAPAIALPSNWVNTGEFNGTPNTGNDGTIDSKSAPFTASTTDVTNINFGIEEKATSNAVNQTIATPVAQTITAGMVTNPVTGNDPEDGAYSSTNGNARVIIDILPTNSVMRYNGNIVTEGTNINNFNPALLSFTNITGGSTSTLFSYSFVDAASVKGSIAIYTISWSTPLPLNLLSFTVNVNHCAADISWTTSNERNILKFIVESSKDGIQFAAATDAVAANNNQQENKYNTHINEVQNNSYYRLAMYETDGQVGYSNIVKQAPDCAGNGLGNWYIAPNPAVAQSSLHLYYANAVYDGQTTVTVYNTLGQKVYENSKYIDKGNGSISLNNMNLAAGQYVIKVSNAEAGENSSIRLIIQ